MTNGAAPKRGDRARSGGFGGRRAQQRVEIERGERLRVEVDPARDDHAPVDLLRGPRPVRVHADPAEQALHAQKRHADQLLRAKPRGAARRRRRASAAPPRPGCRPRPDPRRSRRSATIPRRRRIAATACLARPASGTVPSADTGGSSAAAGRSRRFPRRRRGRTHRRYRRDRTDPARTLRLPTAVSSRAARRKLGADKGPDQPPSRSAGARRHERKFACRPRACALEWAHYIARSEDR